MQPCTWYINLPHNTTSTKKVSSSTPVIHDADKSSACRRVHATLPLAIKSEKFEPYFFFCLRFAHIYVNIWSKLRVNLDTETTNFREAFRLFLNILYDNEPPQVNLENIINDIIIIVTRRDDNPFFSNRFDYTETLDKLTLTCVRKLMNRYSIRTEKDFSKLSKKFPGVMTVEQLIVLALFVNCGLPNVLSNVEYHSFNGNENSTLEHNQALAKFVIIHHRNNDVLYNDYFTNVKELIDILIAHGVPAKEVNLMLSNPKMENITPFLKNIMNPVSQIKEPRLKLTLLITMYYQPISSDISLQLINQFNNLDKLFSDDKLAPTILVLKQFLLLQKISNKSYDLELYESLHSKINNWITELKNLKEQISDKIEAINHTLNNDQKVNDDELEKILLFAIIHKDKSNENIAFNKAFTRLAHSFVLIYSANGVNIHIKSRTHNEDIKNETANGNLGEIGSYKAVKLSGIKITIPTSTLSEPTPIITVSREVTVSTMAIRSEIFSKDIDAGVKDSMERDNFQYMTFFDPKTKTNRTIFYMDYHGKTLHFYLNQNTLQAEDKKAILQQIIYKFNIIYTDIKAKNLLIQKINDRWEVTFIDTSSKWVHTFCTYNYDINDTGDEMKSKSCSILGLTFMLFQIVNETANNKNDISLLSRILTNPRDTRLTGDEQDWSKHFSNKNYFLLNEVQAARNSNLNLNNLSNALSSLPIELRPEATTFSTA